MTLVGMAVGAFRELKGQCAREMWYVMLRMRQEQNTPDLLGHVQDFGLYPKRIWKPFSHFKENGVIGSVFKEITIPSMQGSGIETECVFFQGILPKSCEILI